MQIRTSFISQSILEAIHGDPREGTSLASFPASESTGLVALDDATGTTATVHRGDDKSKLHHRVIRVILTFFSFFKLLLVRYRATDFHSLRQEVWRLDEQEYTESFHIEAGEVSRRRNDGTGSRGRRKGKRKDLQLKPVGDLGYSGSTFFTTANSKYLIKSLPRRFEHQFFTHDLFEPYVAHMRKYPHSLLVRITDMVYTPLLTLGGIVGTAPTHHILMENLLYGKERAPGGGTGWETYDLKPNDYFFPERDLAIGKLVPQSVKDKLFDEFPDRVRVTPQQKKELLDILADDTRLLADNNAIDYSLFLVRYPGPNSRPAPTEDQPLLDGSTAVPTVASDANPWRAGIVDAQGKWTYRVVVLDFFWARHKFRARAMTGLVKTFNKIAHKGPMSITANPNEYRERFLGMVRDIVVVEE